MTSTTTIIVVGVVATAAIAAVVLLKPKPKPSRLEQVVGGLGQLAEGLGIGRVAPPPQAPAKVTKHQLATASSEV